MRVVIQRTKEANVTVDGTIVGKIDHGYVLLVGFMEDDNEEIIQKMVKKIIELRINEDDNGKMNLSILDTKGSILSISQFTLYASCRKGRRPSFDEAANAQKAKRLYELFNEELKKYPLSIETGIFQADMKVQLLNDGPVTIILDSKEIF